jgi:hypothetical protein
VLQQVFRAGRVDRSLYNELIFDDYATGNAVLIVAAVYALPAAIGLLLGAGVVNGILGILNASLTGIVRWLLVSLAFWAMAAKVFQRDGRIPTTIRLTGFAHVAFIPFGLSYIFPEVFAILLLVSLAWFFVSLTAIGQVLFDLDRQQSMAAGGVAVAVWWVLVIVLGR